MECLWSRSAPASVRDVLAELQASRPLAYTTVMTVLNNLHRKGAVTREMAERAWLYEPSCSREQHTALMLRGVLGAAGDRRTALMHFVSELDPDDIVGLTAAVQAAERRRDGA